MIIKVFSQGSSDGSRHIDYLLDEESHQGYKPEVIEGNPELTKTILRSMTNRKNRYTAGVISFKYGEHLTESQQRQLIAEFKSAFAPFDDEPRSNFLFVRHYDKGRLELHWVTARQDLKTGRAWSIFVPGRANTLFYESFVRLQNYRYGFQQVDGKTMTASDIGFYSKTFHDLHTKRKAYIANRYEKPVNNYKTNNKRRMKNASTQPNRTSYRPAYQEDVRLRKLIEFLKPPSGTDRANISGSNQNPSHGATSYQSSQLGNAENSDRSKSDFDSSKLTEWRRKQFGKPQINCPAMSIEDEIYTIAIQLNTCEKHEAPALIARLNFLQGVREHGIPKGKPKLK